MKKFFLLILLVVIGLQVSATTTLNKKVGDVFTVSVTKVNGQNGVTWTWDTQCLEVVSNLAASAGTMEFRAIKASSTGVIIQAQISYYANGSIGKSFQDWKVIIDDNSSGGNSGGDNNGGNGGSSNQYPGTNLYPSSVGDYEMVDLGLRVLWASKNVGAKTESDYGSLFAWGETTTKTTFTESNSTTEYIDVTKDSRFETSDRWSGYSWYYKFGSSLDAATKYMGSEWRTPTTTELCDLMSFCTHEVETRNGVTGYKITGPNGNSIFMPIDYFDYGTPYWSSETLNPLYYAAGYTFGGKTFMGDIFEFQSDRFEPCFIRAVADIPKNPEPEDPGFVEFEYEGFDYWVLYNADHEVGLRGIHDKTVKELTIPSYVYYNGEKYTVTSIRDHKLPITTKIFEGCNNLSKVIIPEPIYYIDSNAFSNLPLLETVILPESLKSLYGAFTNCPSLKSLYIPASVERLSEPCYGCENFTEYIVDKNNPNFASVDGIVYSKDLTAINFCPAGIRGKLTIPESVTKVDGLSGKHFIEVIELPSTLKEIDSFPFWDNLSLKYVICKAVVPPSGDTGYNSYVMDFYDTLTVYVPDASVSLYKETDNWSLYKNLLPLSEKPLDEYDYVKVEKIELSVTTLTMTEGEMVELKAIVSPSNATDQTLTWSSSDSSIVKVINGVISALRPGEATITVSSADGVNASCKVTVQKKVIEVESIMLTWSEDEQPMEYIDGAYIEVGSHDLLINVHVYPENADDKTVTWSSSDEKVAIMKDSKVLALSPGEAVLTATAHNGVNASFKIRVRPLPDRIELNYKNINIKEGEHFQLEATIYPEEFNTELYHKIIEWESTNPKIATVDDKGMVTGVAAGEVDIKVNYEGKIEALCTVTVSTVEVENPEEDENQGNVSGDEEPGNDDEIENPDNNGSNGEVDNPDDEGDNTETDNPDDEGNNETDNPDDNGDNGEIDNPDDTGIESIFNDSDSVISIFTMNGILVKKDCHPDDINKLEKGIYIIISGNNRYKISR